ncbi:hypothetical protein [Streptomyces sp. NPDC096033]|uniref:hypothetical protein n=1 Tax=Streptomyces sp. NPDC096033 TaxID=3366071 RepID=UPI00382C8AD6
MSDQYPETVKDAFGFTWTRRDDLEKPGFSVGGEGPLYQSDKLFPTYYRYSIVQKLAAGR